MGKIQIVSRRGNPLSNSFVWNVLKNPVYAGQIRHRGKTHPGLHPAIIDKDTFARVQKLIEENPRRRPEKKSWLPFAGLIQCKECKSMMTPAFTNKKTKEGTRRYNYYRCSNLTHKGWNTCGTKQISAERFHEGLHQNLRRISLDKNYLSSTVRFERGSQTRSRPFLRNEPNHLEGELTAKEIQKNLKQLLLLCAQKKGTEKTAAIRRSIRKITYGQKTISVELFRNPLSDQEDTGFSADSRSALRAEPSFVQKRHKKRGLLYETQGRPSSLVFTGKNGGESGI